MLSRVTGGFVSEISGHLQGLKCRMYATLSRQVGLAVCRLRCTFSLLRAGFCYLIFHDCTQTRVPSSSNSCCPIWLLQQSETGYVTLLFSTLEKWTHLLKPFSLGTVCTCVWDCTDDCRRLRTSGKKLPTSWTRHKKEYIKEYEVPTGLNWRGIGSNGVDICDACVKHELFFLTRRNFIRVN
jgi:hypothetical protein